MSCGFVISISLINYLKTLKKELTNFWFLVHKMTVQSLKLGKFIINQVANTFGHVRWLSIILTPVVTFQMELD